MSTVPPVLPPPRRRLGRAFARAAGRYDAAAVVQQRVEAELDARLEEARLTPAVVLDVGTGTGRALRQLKKRYRRALVLGVDLSMAMLAEARRKRGFLSTFELARADAAALPLRAESVDLGCSSFLLHWLGDPAAAFAELARVLRPGATLQFATLGPDSLNELREALAVTGEALPAPPDLEALGGALMRAGFRNPVLDVDRYRLTYAGVPELLRDLRANGGLALRAGGRGLGGRARLAAIAAAYPRLPSEPRIGATIEVIYARAERDSAPARRAVDPSEVVVSLDRLGRRRP